MRLATAESLPQIKATRAWAGGYTGAGKTIAILDSGVDKAHPALSNKVVAEACFSTNDPAIGYTSLCPGNAPTSTEPDSGKHCDVLSGLGNCGHGTHIAGIAAGRSGVAINANVISIQVMSYVTDPEVCGFGNCLRSQTSDVMAALQHVYNLRASHDIAAVNISLVTDIIGILHESLRYGRRSAAQRQDRSIEVRRDCDRCCGGERRVYRCSRLSGLHINGHQRWSRRRRQRRCAG